MKTISIILLLLISQNSFAQRDSVNGKIPTFNIHLTTMNDNVLKGLLLVVKDSSIRVYPGNRKEWKTDKKYKPVEYIYSRIKAISLKKEKSALKKILTPGKGRKIYYLNGNGTAFIDFKKIINETLN